MIHMTPITWSSGKHGYRSHSLLPVGGTYNTLLQDVELSDTTDINQLFNEVLAVRQTNTVEVLYSGGMDSEFVLRSCVVNKIPVRAITMRLLVSGYPINTHDLYYSEKFCRENSIEQKLIDLHVDKFFEGGDHLKYLRPYAITEPHVATHLWLFEQCSGYPVLGGEYSWPWSTDAIVSPHRHEYSCYDKFLNDNNIPGIGSMLSHSLDINFSFIRNHLALMQRFPTGHYRGSSKEIPMFKRDLFCQMGLGVFELRMKHYGWEGLPSSIFNKFKYKLELLKEFGIIKSSITWQSKIAAALGGPVGSNDKYS